jgi:hypothetical protein
MLIAMQAYHAISVIGVLSQVGNCSMTKGVIPKAGTSFDNGILDFRFWIG